MLGKKINKGWEGRLIKVGKEEKRLGKSSKKGW